MNKTNLAELQKLKNTAKSFVVKEAVRVINMSGMTQPPFRPEVLARYCGIDRITRSNLCNIDALLIPHKEKFEIRINATHSQERQGFSCAHELAHTFLLVGQGKTLFDELLSKMGPKAAYHFEETLCNIAASELLMPYSVFRQHASPYFRTNNCNFSISAIPILAKSFQVSVQAAAIRFAKVNPERCYVAKSETGNNFTFDNHVLEVKWAQANNIARKMRFSSRASEFISLKLSSGKYSSVEEALKCEHPTYSYEYLSSNAISGLCYIESQAFGYGDRRYVISIIYPQDSDY